MCFWRRKKTKPRPISPFLTPQQLKVLTLISQGYGNPEIAYRLKITEHTVKNHVSEILLKLGVDNRTHAVVRALKDGIISLPEKNKHGL